MNFVVKFTENGVIRVRLAGTDLIETLACPWLTHQVITALCLIVRAFRIAGNIKAKAAVSKHVFCATAD